MLAFLIVLSILVLFHELGHYIAARYFQVDVESFSIGFGPRLIGFKHNETDFKISILPLGGYVKMKGELIGESSEDPNELLAKPRWQRLIIFAMGPIFNFILALVVLAGLYMYHFEQPEFLEREAQLGYVQPESAAAQAGLVTGDVIQSFDDSEITTWQGLMMATAMAVDRTVDVTYERNGSLFESRIKIPEDSVNPGAPDAGWFFQHKVALGEVLANSPAEAVGLQSGDLLLSMDGIEITSITQTVDVVQGSEGRDMEVLVERDNNQLAFTVQPKREGEAGNWRIGTQLQAVYPTILEDLSFTQAMQRSVETNYMYAGLIFKTLGALVTGNLSLKSLEGPVGIYQHTKDAASESLGALIQLMALISINLGIINLLPIPVLDGGHISMLFVEAAMRRDFSLTMKKRITQVGILFIVVLFGLVMYNDILRQFSPG